MFYVYLTTTFQAFIDKCKEKKVDKDKLHAKLKEYVGGAHFNEFMKNAWFQWNPTKRAEWNFSTKNKQQQLKYPVREHFSQWAQQFRFFVRDGIPLELFYLYKDVVYKKSMGKLEGQKERERGYVPQTVHNNRAIRDKAVGVSYVC